MNHPAKRMDCKRTTEDSTGVLVLCFGAVFFGSLLLRLHDIGSKPFWIDEVVTVHRAGLPLLHLIGDSLRAHHMPAFFLVTSWVLPFGSDEFSMRLLPAIFGACSCALGFGIARSIGGLKAGLAAGMLFALSPAMVQYGQEARSYTMVILAILIGLWGVVGLATPPAPNADKKSQRYAWAAYVAGTVLALNILSVALFWFLAANLVGVVLIRQRGPQFRRHWLKAQLLIIAICLPAYLAIEWRGGHGAMGAFGSVPPLDLPRIWWAFSGTYLFYVISLIKVQVFVPGIPGVGIMIAALAAGGLVAVRKQHGVLALLLIAGICLPVCLLVVSMVEPVFRPRYLLWGAAPFLVCAGLGFTLLPRRLQWPALAIFGAALAVNLVPYYHDETKPRWDLAAAQMTNFQHGDLLLADDGPGAFMITYFLKREGVALPVDMCTTDVGRALAWQDAGHRVWAVQGPVGTEIDISQAQFLQRITALGTPQFSVHAGSDILLLRFNGKIAPEHLSMNIAPRAAGQLLQ